MEQTTLNDVKGAATNAAATALLAYHSGEEIAQIKANAAGTIHRLGENGIPYLVRASDGVPVPMEAFGARPTMIRQLVTVHDTKSFVRYTNRFHDSGTVVFADRIDLRFSAVLDYHSPSDTADGARPVARWGRHRATVKLLETDAWKEWVSRHGKEMSQSDFGAWFEDRIPDILTPDAAVIIEMARHFEARKDVSYSGKVDPDTGSVALRYVEDAAGIQREGSVTIVRQFTLDLLPFLGAEQVRVDARIRWRVVDGKLLLRYELIRHKEVLEQAFLAELEDVEATLDKDIAVLAGPAPATQP